MKRDQRLGMQGYCVMEGVPGVCWSQFPGAGWLGPLAFLSLTAPRRKPGFVTGKKNNNVQKCYLNGNSKKNMTHIFHVFPILTNSSPRFYFPLNINHLGWHMWYSQPGHILGSHWSPSGTFHYVFSTFAFMFLPIDLDFSQPWPDKLIFAVRSHPCRDS